MKKGKFTWLPIDKAAEHYGYSQSESLKRRIRQLRKQGRVIDIGAIPERYSDRKEHGEGDHVHILWAHPKAFLVRSDATEELFIAKRAKRKK